MSNDERYQEIGLRGQFYLNGHPVVGLTRDGRPADLFRVGTVIHSDLVSIGEAELVEILAGDLARELALELAPLVRALAESGSE